MSEHSSIVYADGVEQDQEPGSPNRNQMRQLMFNTTTGSQLRRNLHFRGSEEELLNTQYGVGQLHMLHRATRLRRIDGDFENAPEYSEEVSTLGDSLYGIPLGPNVVAPNSTYTDCKQSSQFAGEYKAIADAIVKVLDEEVTKLSAPMCTVELHYDGYRPGASAPMDFIEIMTSDGNQFWLWRKDGRIVDVEVHPVTGTWTVMRIVAAGIVRLATDYPSALSRYTVLDNAPLRASCSAAPEQGGRWALPFHICSSDVPRNSDVGAIVADCGVYSMGAVSYGRVPAEQVPTACVVLLAANGGKNVTGGVLVAKLGDVGAVVIPTDSVMGERAYPENKLVLPPCERDGTYSSYLLSCVRGTSDHGLAVKYTDLHHNVQVESALSIFSARAPLTVFTRTIEATLSDIKLLAEINKMPYRDVTNGVEVNGVEIQVQFGCEFLHPTSKFSGCDLLPSETTSSEQLMDESLSGFARWLCKDIIYAGRLSGTTKVHVKSSNPYRRRSAGWAEVRFGRNFVPLPEPAITNYVVDFEYFSRGKGPSLEYYVYAVGIAKVVEGFYRGSILAVDTSTEALEFVANNKLRKADVENFHALRGIGKSEATSALNFVREAAKSPECRVYAKGRDNDDRILQGKVVKGTRLFKPVAKDPILREIGALTPKSDALADEARWDKSHNPCKEAVLFARAAGLFLALPEEADVGNDSLHALTHQQSAVYA